MTGTSRTAEQIREHYEIEKRLAQRLLSSSRCERAELYSSVYDELFRLVRDHPQHIRRKTVPSAAVSDKMRLLRRFIRPDICFLEIGAGDCRLSLDVATKVRKAYALEVSEEITRGVCRSTTFEVVHSDGCSIPLPEQTIHVAYSNQVMEHVHPDDAVEQLRNIYTVLVPGGVYVCITPNRLAGPHDISQHFDSVATGLHLREYTFSELSRLFTEIGFKRVDPYLGVRGRFWRVPGPLIRWFEWMMERLPNQLRRRTAHAIFVKNLLESVAVAEK